MYVDCGTLVDGDGRVLEDARFRVEDGRVAEAGPRTEIDAEGDRVDHSEEVVVLGSDPRDGIEAVRDVETVYRAGERIVPDR